MKPTKQFDSKINELFDLMRSGRDAWVKAGVLLVSMVEENPQTYEILIARNPQLRADTLELLERIGRKPEIVDLLLSDSYSSRKILNLPARDLDRATKQPLPVVTQTEGGPRVVRKRLDEMSRTEVDLVFCGNQIRNADEQVEALQQKAKNEAAKDLRYWIEEDGIVMRERSKMKWSELEDLLNRHKAEASKGLQAAMKNGQLKTK
jgi:hypothetical protein